MDKNQRPAPYRTTELLANLRIRLAESALAVAIQAETLAALLEKAAPRGDTERRLHVAALERQIARIERRNATKLREWRGGTVGLEHLLPLPDPRR
jgi:hypothetical protein